MKTSQSFVLQDTDGSSGRAILVTSQLHTEPRDLAARALYSNKKEIFRLDIAGRNGDHGADGPAGAVAQSPSITATAEVSPGQDGGDGIDGCHGSAGNPGGPGGHGGAGGTVLLTLSGNPEDLEISYILDGNVKETKYQNLGETEGVFLVMATGGGGGNGGNGGAGSDGANGSQGTKGGDGEPGADATLPGDDGDDGLNGGSGGKGGAGGHGGDGGVGGDGGNGGDGGTVVISAFDPRLLVLAEVDSRRGSGGAGGAGGRAGRGGHGGLGGVGGVGGKGGKKGIEDAEGNFGVDGADGLTGSSGPNGSNGRDGNALNGGIHGRDGREGTVIFRVVDGQGRAIEEGRDRYNCTIVSYCVCDGNADGIFEPGETAYVSDIVVMNNGHLSLPIGAEIHLCFSPQSAPLVVLKSHGPINVGSLGVGETRRLKDRIYFELLALDSPELLNNNPLLALANGGNGDGYGYASTVTLWPQCSMLGRVFEDPAAPCTLAIQFPVRIVEAIVPKEMGPQQEARVTLTLENISGRDWGSKAAVRAAQVATVYSTSATNSNGGVGGGGAGANNSANPGNSISSTSVPLEVELEASDCVEVSAVEERYSQRISGNKMRVAVAHLPPSHKTTVSFTVVAPKSLTYLYQHIAWEFRVILAGKVIENRKCRLTEILPLWNPAVRTECMLVVSSAMSLHREEFMAWTYLLSHLMDLSLGFWDLEKQSGLTGSPAMPHWVNQAKCVVIPRMHPLASSPPSGNVGRNHNQWGNSPTGSFTTNTMTTAASPSSSGGGGGRGSGAGLGKGERERGKDRGERSGKGVGSGGILGTGVDLSTLRAVDVATHLTARPSRHTAVSMIGATPSMSSSSAGLGVGGKGGSDTIGGNPLRHLQASNSELDSDASRPLIRMRSVEQQRAESEAGYSENSMVLLGWDPKQLDGIIFDYKGRSPAGSPPFHGCFMRWPGLCAKYCFSAILRPCLQFLGFGGGPAGNNHGNGNSASLKDGGSTMGGRVSQSTSSNSNNSGGGNNLSSNSAGSGSTAKDSLREAATKRANNIRNSFQSRDHRRLYQAVAHLVPTPGTCGRTVYGVVEVHSSPLWRNSRMVTSNVCPPLTSGFLPYMLTLSSGPRPPPAKVKQTQDDDHYSDRQSTFHVNHEPIPLNSPFGRALFTVLLALPVRKYVAIAMGGPLTGASSGSGNSHRLRQCSFLWSPPSVQGGHSICFSRLCQRFCWGDGPHSSEHHQFILSIHDLLFAAVHHLIHREFTTWHRLKGRPGIAAIEHLTTLTCTCARDSLIFATRVYAAFTRVIEDTRWAGFPWFCTRTARGRAYLGEKRNAIKAAILKARDGKEMMQQAELMWCLPTAAELIGKSAIRFPTFELPVFPEQGVRFV